MSRFVTGWAGGADVLPRKDLTRKDVRGLVERTYRRAGESPCCDPRDLAEGLGFAPCPSPGEVAILRDGVLRYPERASLTKRGLSIYHLLALHLWPFANYLSVMFELILPEDMVRQSVFTELGAVQPHAPLSIVQSVFMTHGGSGIMRAIRPIRAID